MTKYFHFYYIFFFSISFAQDYEASKLESILEDSYAEDQFYINVVYNVLYNKPKGMNQTGFSGGYGFGFIKDIPFKKNGTFGVGIGAGFSYNAYVQNLKIETLNGVSVQSIVENYNTNKYVTMSIDIPFELRFRNATKTRFKFFRWYTGLKTSFYITKKAKHKSSSENLRIRDISNTPDIALGITSGIGYSAYTLYVYYGLSPLLKDVTIGGDSFANISELKFGLIFYLF